MSVCIVMDVYMLICWGFPLLATRETFRFVRHFIVVTIYQSILLILSQIAASYFD